jgi:hypothetical protein
MRISDGFKARLEFVVDEVCGGLFNGGDHAVRVYVAERLLGAAETGVFKLEDLKTVARQALDEVSRTSRTA